MASTKGDTSLRIVAGPNGIMAKRSFGSTEMLGKDSIISCSGGNSNNNSSSNGRPSDSIEFSFSSYLQQQQSQETSKPKDSEELSVFEAENYFSEEKSPKATEPNLQNELHLNLNLNLVDNLNLGIKPAEYSSGMNSPLSASSILSLPPKIPVMEVNRGLKSMSFRGVAGTSTPTTCSEASSWNSRSVLLAKEAPGATINGGGGTARKLGRKRGFGCKCPCSGAKSVEIEEDSISATNPCRRPLPSTQSSPLYRSWPEKPNIPKPRTELRKIPDLSSGTDPRGLSVPDPGRIFRASLETKPEPATTQFSFPVIPKSGSPVQNPSLEVFGSPLHKSSSTPRQSTELHRSLALLGLEKARRSFTFTSEFERRRAENARTSNTAGDADSDSSSDLFEIESFSTQGYPVFQSSGGVPMADDVSSVGSGFSSAMNRSYAEHNGMHNLGSIEEQSSYYEPSEVSVDWSDTQSGSVFFEQRRPLPGLSLRSSALSKPMGNKSSSSAAANGGTSTGMLSSCKCEKAVRVAEATHQVKNLRSRSFDLSAQDAVSVYATNSIRSSLDLHPRSVSVGRSAQH